MNKQAILYSGEYWCSFDYDTDIVSKFQHLPSRKWEPKTKQWRVPENAFTTQILKEWGFLPQSINVPKQEDPNKVDPYLVKKQLQDKMRTTGRHYQEEGVIFLNQQNGKALIADEMGLGKSWQAIAWIALQPPMKTIVICPASLKINWQREFKQHAGMNIVVAENSILNQSKMSPGDTLVINYDLLITRGKNSDPLSPWGHWILCQQPDCVICDESHYLKSSTTKRYKATKKILDCAKHKIFLTGTPIISRPIEIFTVANILDPTNFNNRFRFGVRYCGGTQSRFGWNFSGATNLSELNLQLSKFMIRRKKEDVLPELPKKQRIVIPISISNKREYQQAENNFLQWVRSKFGKDKVEKVEKAEVISQISHLKRLSAVGKMEGMIEWIDDYLETTGKKLIVFGYHHEIINAVISELTKLKYKTVVLTGETSQKDRQEAVDSFQNNLETRVFVGNIQAAGQGINLTAADTTCFIEFAWTPGAHDQAESRVDRLTQTSDSISAYYLIGVDTIDEQLVEVLDSKRKVVTMATDGQEVNDYDVISELLARAKQRANSYNG
jgi:SWI/SNF-related matrix-associated actin-dependent regulator 1 of chromatin subfamily A